MKDRIPTEVLSNGAIRWADYDADENFIGYRYSKRADEPSEEGTPLNKATILADVTASLLGLTSDGNVDTALTALYHMRVPIGSILMWSGAIVDIPDEWALCDGENGTPNLQNKFIVGAGDTYAVGATGGEATHTLVASEMPVHTHVQNSHNHNITGNTVPGGSSAIVAWGTTTGTSQRAANVAATAVNQNAGGDAAHENRPPYYSLAYIMKVS